MNLKPAKTVDKNYLWQIYEQAMKAHISTIWGWDLAWQKCDFKKNLAKYTTSLIIKSEQAIGYIQHQTEGQKCYINMLILEPSQQSRGIGAELLNNIISENNLNTLSLRCFKVNKCAYDFYLREGFEVVSEEQHFFLLRKFVNPKRTSISLHND